MKDVFKLTEKQQQILQRIATEIDNFRKAGGMLVWDCDVDEPCALNTLGCDDIKIVWDEQIAGYEAVDPADALDYHIPNGFMYLGCEDTILVRPRYDKNMF